MSKALEAPGWLVSGPTALGIRFAICDQVEKQSPDGQGDLDQIALLAICGEDPKTYLIGAHFTFQSEFGYIYDFWEYRAVQMGENNIPLVRETTEEEDAIIGG